VDLEVATAAGTEKEEEKGENPFGIGDVFCLSVCLCVSVINKSFPRACCSTEREREVERVNGSKKIFKKKRRIFKKFIKRHTTTNRASARAIYTHHISNALAIFLSLLLLSFVERDSRTDVHTLQLLKQ
jgi:hypothetical protein